MIIKTAIIGASGYTGVELLRLLISHPNVEIKYLVASSNAGKEMGELYSHLKFKDLPVLTTIEDINFNDLDVVFCCLPHATSQKIIKDIPNHVKVIDLSADFRLQNIDVYEQYYGEHFAKDMQKEAVYGLSEVYREQIKSSRLVACPGCYPTSSLLPLIPLVKSNLIDGDIVIDSKSGITGAGRSLKQGVLFTEMNENLKVYNICSHRHGPEIEEVLSDFGNKTIVNFIPQIVPINRGIVSNIHVKINKDIEVIKKTIKEFYKNKNVIVSDEVPELRDVVYTNKCIIHVAAARSENRIVIVSVIDNLLKGASGQAIQNMNIMFGLDDFTGINNNAIFP